MQTDTRDIYLEMQVNSATPQKLRLMLIEGALRFARRTQDHWRDSALDEGLESLIRAREIIGELIAGIQTEASPLARQVGSLYVYLFSALTEAQQTRDEHQLAAVIKVLEEERETWRQVCSQLPERPVPPPTAAFASREELAPALVSEREAFSIDA
jgi:flagellar protein FliS